MLITHPVSCCQVSERILNENCKNESEAAEATSLSPSFTHPQGGWCKGTHLFRICKCAEGFYQFINDRACTYPLLLRLCHYPFP